MQDDPQVRHRETLREMDGPDGRKVPFVANPLRFSGSPVEYAPPATAPRSSTPGKVLRDWLGEDTV